jgi:hypothetical protein
MTIFQKVFWGTILALSMANIVLFSYQEWDRIEHAWSKAAHEIKSWVDEEKENASEVIRPRPRPVTQEHFPPPMPMPLEPVKKVGVKLDPLFIVAVFSQPYNGPLGWIYGGLAAQQMGLGIKIARTQ